MEEAKDQRQRQAGQTVLVCHSQTSYGEVRLAFHYALGLLLHSCCLKHRISVVNRCDF